MDVNIPENMEGSNMKSFTTDLLNDILQIPSDEPGPELERVHRLGLQKGQNEKPCTNLAKLLWFEDKEKIRRASQKNKELSFKSQKFLIFQDYSAAVSRKRMEYNAIKAALHRQDVSFKLLFPACLVVNIGTETHSYDTSSGALTSDAYYLLLIRLSNSEDMVCNLIRAVFICGLLLDVCFFLLEPVGPFCYSLLLFLFLFL